MGEDGRKGEERGGGGGEIVYACDSGGMVHWSSVMYNASYDVMDEFSDVFMIARDCDVMVIITHI